MGTAIQKSDFPLSILPIELQRIIRELNGSNGFPIDYTASAMLTAISVAIGNTHRVEVKRNWHESAILYMAIVGRPGDCKSHPLTFVMRPFVNADWRNNQDYQKRYREYQQAMSMSRKERVHAGYEQFPKEPKRLRYLVSDVTQEGLSAIHAHNPRGYAYGLMSCRHGSKISLAIIMVQRNNSGYRHSTEVPQCQTVRIVRTPSLSNDHSSRL